MGRARRKGAGRRLTLLFWPPPPCRLLRTRAQLHSAAAAQPSPDVGFACAPDLSRLLVVAPPAPEAAGGILGGGGAQQRPPPQPTAATASPLGAAMAAGAAAAFRFLPSLAPAALAALLAAHCDRRSVAAARAWLGAHAAVIL